MSNFFLKLISGETYIITDEQVKFFLDANLKQKLVAIPGTKIIINTSSISSIIPENELDQSAQKESYLNDGQRIIKKFGVWYLANDPEIRVDENYHSELQENDKTKRLRGSGFEPLIKLPEQEIKRLE